MVLLSIGIAQLDCVIYRKVREVIIYEYPLFLGL